jgi:hypothetical protein
VLDDFEDGVAGDVDPAALEAFAQKVHAAALGVGEQDVAAVVDDAAVDLLGHAVVVAAVPGLHVVDGDAEPLGDDRRERAVGVAEDEQAVGPLGEHDALALRDDAPDLLAEAVAADAEEVVGLPDPQLVEEEFAQPRVEVLARVDEPVVAQAVEAFDDAAEADDLRARAQDGHDLHASMSSS